MSDEGKRLMGIIITISEALFKECGVKFGEVVIKMKDGKAVRSNMEMGWDRGEIV